MIYLMNQKGLTPILIILVILVMVVGGLVISKKISFPVINSQFNPKTIEQSSSDSAKPTQSASPSPKAIKSSVSSTSNNTPIPTPRSSATPTTTPTSTNSNPANPYDLNSATGAVKVIVKPANGDLAYTPSAELSTVSGFKVLNGRSADKITLSGPNRTDNLRGEIVFSTVPPGPYKVRISYNGSWSEQKDVTASSAQQSTVEFSVAGSAPTPTPTPKPKPVCRVSISPSSNGTAPYNANICVGNNSNPYQAVQQEFVDYNGDGNWDYQGVQYGCHSYTFSSAGTYTPKAKITNSSGDESDTCQATVTVN